MQYAIALCLLITLVASQEGQTRTKGVREDLGFGYINSALRSRKLTKREASTVFLLLSWGRALQWKCIDSHAPNSIKILEVADSNLDSCTKGLKNPLPASPWVHNTSTTDYTHSLCRFLKEANSCFLDYTEAIQPCLPRYHGGNFPFSNISQTVINYMCGDDGAIERSKLFWDNKNTCMAEAKRSTNCEEPHSYHKLEDSTFMYSEDSCRCFAGYWKCVKTELHECPIALYNYLDDLTKAVDPIYSPCPINRTV